MILAIDTSADQCAVALGSASRAETMLRGHAERLFPIIEAAMAEARAGYNDLTRLAVCTGPGSFTGIRVSIAATRGLALALGLPAIGITRFEALALPASRAARMTWMEGDIRILGEDGARSPPAADEPVIAVAIAARGGAYRQDFPLGWPERGAPGAMRFELGTRPAPPPDGSIRAGDGWAEAALGKAAVDPCHLAHLAAERAPVAPPAPCYLRPPDADAPRDAPPTVLQQ